MDQKLYEYKIMGIADDDIRTDHFKGELNVRSAEKKHSTFQPQRVAHML